MTRWALLAAGLVACQAAPVVQPPAPTKIDSCDYRVQVHASGLARVHAACRANGPIAFALARPELVPSARGPAWNRSGRVQARSGVIDYAVDLAHLARQSNSFDRALHLGDSFIAPMSSVLVVPEPLTTEIEVTVQVDAEPPLEVAVGLARTSEPDRYRLKAHEIAVATYFAFGKLEQRELSIGAAKLDVTKLDGALDRSFDELAVWIAKSAGAVSDFYGGFPVPRASISVVPRPARDGVVFGKVLPESAPGIALVVGQRAAPQALYSDWILVHELFHLGFPSFIDEGKWLDEGLATYYEPIIRVRAGLYTEAELWQELAESMPQGLPAFTELGLEHATDFRGIYWGGALACLVADVRARQRRLDTGLELGLRALQRAGGNACEVWSLADAIATIDRALGQPTLAPVAKAHAARGSPFDFEALLRDLGVLRTPSGIRLSDAAPLAAVRRAIIAKP